MDRVVLIVLGILRYVFIWSFKFSISLKNTQFDVAIIGSLRLPVS